MRPLAVVRLWVTPVTNLSADVALVTKLPVVLATVIVGAPIVSASVSVAAVYVAFVTTLLEVADALVKAADVGAEILMPAVGAFTVPPVTNVAVPVVSA